MVKICQISSLFNFEDRFDSQDPINMWEMFYFKQSLRAYRLFNEGKADEYEKLCSEVVQKFYEVNRVDKAEAEKLEQEIHEVN